jgi:hypothetical protein
MNIERLLKLAGEFEKLAQEQRKPTPGGVLNVAKQTIKGIIDHPSVIPQAIDKTWDNVLNTIDWARMGPAQQAEFKRKLMIAKLKQAEEMKRVLQEMDYEEGKKLTLQNE